MGSDDLLAWPGSDDGLTRRESEVLVLCAEGLSNREIADRLYLNVETVKTHLKRIFRRLGLYDRSETRLYLDTVGQGGAWTAEGDPSERDVGGPVELDERLALAGVAGAPHPLLARIADDADRAAPGLIEELYRRLRSHTATAGFFTDDAVVARLARHQQHYLHSLFADPIDEAHVEHLLATGSTHHRIRLLPQWFLATHGLIVCDQLPLIFELHADRRDAFAAAAALVARALFDAGLVLDAYEVHQAREVVSQLNAAAGVDDPPTVERRPTGRSVSSRHRVVDVTTSRDDTSDRLEFMQITSATPETLRGVSGHVSDRIRSVLDEFYDRAERSPSLVALMPPGTRERLVDEVARYWDELTHSDFGETYTASRRRVGVIHERIGLAPQFYLAAMARQLGDVLRGLADHPTAGLAEADALVRTVFLDITFVIDAYLEARVDALLEAGRFADQVVSGLETSVVIVDERNRVSFANSHFLEFTGTAAAVVHRLPIGDALAVDGLVELVDAVRRSGSQRSVTTEFRSRYLRVAVLPMKAPESGSRHLVAVVLDDLSDVYRAVERKARIDERFDTILSAVHTVLWEIEPENLMVNAVSQSVVELTGRRDVDLVGRSAWFELVHPDDRAELVRMVRGVGDGSQHALDVRFRHVSGEIRSMRTCLTGRARNDGRIVACGVSFDLDDSRIDQERNLLVIGDLAADAVAAIETASELADVIDSGSIDSATVRLVRDALDRLRLATRPLRFVSSGRPAEPVSVDVDRIAGELGAELLTKSIGVGEAFGLVIGPGRHQVAADPTRLSAALRQTTVALAASLPGRATTSIVTGATTNSTGLTITRRAHRTSGSGADDDAFDRSVGLITGLLAHADARVSTAGIPGSWRAVHIELPSMHRPSTEATGERPTSFVVAGHAPRARGHVADRVRAAGYPVAEYPTVHLDLVSGSDPSGVVVLVCPSGAEVETTSMLATLRAIDDELCVVMVREPASDIDEVAPLEPIDQLIDDLIARSVGALRNGDRPS